MKKFFIILVCIISNSLFSQGTLNIFNYSVYDMQGRLFARGNQNCYPAVFTSYEFPASTAATMLNYNSSLPYITGWSARTSATAPITNQTPPNSGLLTVLSPLTRWQFSWFLIKDSNGVQTGDQYMMGIDSFSAPCGTSPVNEYQAGTFTTTAAFWFYLPSTNETTILVQ
jgi:hypothetical protein